jgi:hypothetical protein
MEYFAISKNVPKDQLHKGKNQKILVSNQFQIFHLLSVLVQNSVFGGKINTTTNCLQKKS